MNQNNNKMSNTKMTPRQKMINMMYLVLTALLAMNVSKEVLNAFKIVNKGIETSNESLQKRNADYYAAFEALNQKDETATIIQLSALSSQTKVATNEALNYITQIQEEIKQESGMKIENGTEEFKKADDVTTATRILTSPNNEEIKGELLRQKLLSLRNQYLQIIDEGNLTLKGSDAYKDYQTVYASVLPLKEQSPTIKGLGNEQKTWAEFNFSDVPVIASDVILEKLKNDIINSETQVLEYLLQQSSGDVIDFDVLEAKVIAPKSYLASGKNYEADIFISAASSSTQMDVFVGKVNSSIFENKQKLFVENEKLPFEGDYKQIKVENGKAKFEERASGVGNKNYEGIVRVKKPTGGFDLYPFYADYEVAPPSGFSISPTKMNVLYIGVDNPIDITVSGAKSDKDVSASISNGSLIKQGNGKYIAKVTQPGIVKVNVSANVNDKKESFAPMEFRVLRIPDPQINLCGFKTSNKMNKSKIQACTGLIAQNEDFVFGDSFKIISFNTKKRTGTDIISADNNGPIFKGKTQNLINNLQSKDALIFDNIVVQDPAGNKRTLSGAIYIEIN